MKKIFISLIIFCNPALAAQYILKDLNETVKFISTQLECKQENEVFYAKPQQPSAAPEQKVLKYESNPQERPEYEKVLKRVDAGKDGRQRILETTSWPYRFFGHLSLNFPNGEYGGTGVLVGPHHILTCGHNVYDRDSKQWVTRINGFFALNENAAPFDVVQAVRIYVHNKWVEHGDRNYDLALLVIDKSLGLKIGWSGLMYLPDEKIKKKEISITGYPGDKGFKQMWHMKHTVLDVEDERYFYEIDTAGGQSGSPIWLDKFDNPYVVGIHTLGEGRFGEGNSGVRLSLAKLKLIIEQWMSQTHKHEERLILLPKDKAIQNVCAECSETKINALVHACKNGHETCVEVLLANGANIESKDASGFTPLHLACLNGHKACVDALLANGANTEVRNEKGVIPLHLACLKGHEACVQALLAKGANTELKAPNGDTPLHLASMIGHEGCIQALLAKGANMESKDANGLTPLHYACRNGHKACVQDLLAKGANTEVKEKNGFTPLHLACIKGHEASVQALLAKGANPEVKDPNGDTPLHLASMIGHEACIQELLAKGANIESKNANELTPLHLACRNGQKACALELLAKGANTELKEKNGFTPLHIACRNGHEACVQALLTKGANPEVRDPNGVTPLHYACLKGHEACVQALLANGANPEVKAPNGDTPLHVASMIGHKACIQELLANGANTEVKDPNGLTPLHVACLNGHEACVQALLAKGANTEAKDRCGNTPLMLVREYKSRLLDIGGVEGQPAALRRANFDACEQILLAEEGF